MKKLLMLPALMLLLGLSTLIYDEERSLTGDPSNEQLAMRPSLCERQCWSAFVYCMSDHPTSQAICEAELQICLDACNE